MSANSALCVLHFLLFLFLNQVEEIANARVPDCKIACKKHRPPGTSGPYALDCDTLDRDNLDQVECGYCSDCPKEICDKTNAVGLFNNVTLNCPDATYDDDDDKVAKPADKDEGLTRLEVFFIISGCAVGIVLIIGCIYWVGSVIVYRRIIRRRQREGDPMQQLPPPITGYPGAGAGYGSDFTYPPSSSGASTTSTVQQEKTTGQSAVS